MEYKEEQNLQKTSKTIITYNGYLNKDILLVVCKSKYNVGCGNENCCPSEEYEITSLSCFQEGVCMGWDEIYWHDTISGEDVDESIEFIYEHFNDILECFNEQEFNSIIKTFIMNGSQSGQEITNVFYNGLKSLHLKKEIEENLRGITQPKDVLKKRM